MIVKHIRTDIAVYVTVALVLLSLVWSCTKTTISDPKGDLLSSLKGQEVEGYLFSLNEDNAQTTSSLTNNALDSPVTLGKGDSSLVLRYTRVQDKKTNAINTYKSEVIKKDTSLTLLVTELGTNKVVEEKPFPAPGPTCQPPGQFDSLTDCINEFNCANKGPLLCEANRTCDPQFAALTCCLKNGQIFSVHLIIRPDRLICTLRDLVPDLEGLVLTQD
jgi:hypothetical protein